MTTVAIVHSRAGAELVEAARKQAQPMFEAPQFQVRWNRWGLPELTDAAHLPDPGIEVIDLDALLAPYAAAGWQPGEADVALLRALARQSLGVVDTIVVESIDHPVSRVLAEVFDAARVVAVEPGWGAFGPPTQRRRTDFEQRIVGLVHHTVGASLQSVWPQPVCRVEASPATEAAPGSAVVFGSELVAAGLATDAEEVGWHRDLLTRAGAAAERVVFVPDPAMSPAQRARITVGLEVDTEVAEWPPAWLPVAAFGIFAPQLVDLAARDVPVAVIGVRALLHRLRPYHHPARTALTVTDALVSSGLTEHQGQHLAALVAYLMRPEWHPDGRERAEQALTELGALAQRYTDRGRLEVLGLAPRRSLGARVRARLLSHGGRG